MKKIIKSIACMAVIVTALSFLCAHFGGWAQSGSHYYEQQLHGLKDWFVVIIVIAFFTGFLPVFIYESIKALRPAPTPADMPAMSAEQPISAALYVGQVFTSEGSNCVLRIKAIKPVTIEFTLAPVNIFADMQDNQYNYILSTSLY